MDRILQTKFAKEFGSITYMQQYGAERGQMDVDGYLDSLKDREIDQGFFDRKRKIQINGMYKYKLLCQEINWKSLNST